jgi:hypothetical protein
MGHYLIVKRKGDTTEMTSYQNDLLGRSPFGVRFDEVATLCTYHHYYRFSPGTVRVFRARFPQDPIRIDGYIYLIEISAAGPRVSDGRVTRLIQVDIANPTASRIVESGAAVKRAWKELVKQAIDLERAERERGRA